MARMPHHWPKITRDVVLFGTGLILTIHETLFYRGEERPYLLMMFAGMMGLPVFLRQDEKGKPQKPNGG